MHETKASKHGKAAAVTRVVKPKKAERGEPNLDGGGNRLWQQVATNIVQRRSRSGGAPPAKNNAVGKQLNRTVTSPGPGAPLSEHTRSQIEPVLGHDLSAVRVHNNSSAQMAAENIHAKAFTHQNNIFLGANQSADDIGLMAHEATHVMQQSGDRSEQCLQRASLKSDGEYFLAVGREGSSFSLADLINGVSRRYQLDYRSSFEVARWLDEQHQMFRNSDRRYDEVRIPMPRMVAFFMVDWVDPFSINGGQFGIDQAAFNKAQDIWAQENVFVGFRRGGAVGGAAFRQIDFEPAQRADGQHDHVSVEETNLLALRSRAGLPPGFFHIVVTGNTTEATGTTGKAIRSRQDQPIDATSEGILLFAGTWVDEGYQQVVPRGDDRNEIGELLAHEIGHFLFNLSHYQPPVMEGDEIMIRSKDDIMGERRNMDPNDSLGDLSREQVNEAFATGNIPRPATATSRETRLNRKPVASQTDNNADLGVQPQLTIGPVNDPLEREADAVADLVLRKPCAPASPPQVTAAQSHQINSGLIQPLRWSTVSDTGKDKTPWGSGGPDGDVYSIETDAGTVIKAWKPHDGTTYWCHGFTFGGSTAPMGPFSFWGVDVPTILSDDGWQRQPDSCVTQTDEILIFTDNHLAHSGVVESVNYQPSGDIDERTSLLESKWGGGAHNIKSWRDNANHYGNYQVWSKSPVQIGDCENKGEHEK